MTTQVWVASRFTWAYDQEKCSATTLGVYHSWSTAWNQIMREVLDDVVDYNEHEQFMHLHPDTFSRPAVPSILEELVAVLQHPLRQYGKADMDELEDGELIEFQREGSVTFWTYKMECYSLRQVELQPPTDNLSVATKAKSRKRRH